MFEAFPSMKDHSQISLPRIASILKDPQPHPFAQTLQDLLQPLYRNHADYEQAQLRTLQAVSKQGLGRQQFYSLLSKSLLKFLKRELKTIEELIALHSRNNQQVELSRLTLDKTIKQYFSNLQHSAANVFELIEGLQINQEWECNCKTQQCVDNRSSQQFIIDIFGYFFRSSEIINRQLKDESERQKLAHKVFSSEFHPQKKKYWRCGLSSGELILQIEKSCQQLKKQEKQKQQKGMQKESKSKKKRKNRRAKHKQSEDIINEDNLQLDQQERNLSNFLINLKIQENDRGPCIVTEEWVNRIAKRRYKLH